MVSTDTASIVDLGEAVNGIAFLSSTVNHLGNKHKWELELAEMKCRAGISLPGRGTGFVSCERNIDCDGRRDRNFGRVPEGGDYERNSSVDVK